MPAKEILERQLIFGSVHDKPVRLRITHTIAEDDIEPPRNLIDEVTHVSFEAAIIVTRKEEPRAVIKKYPPSEMDGIHSRQKSTVVNMSRRILHGEE